jgi:hypothetical protein
MLMGALGQWPRRTPNAPAASFAAAIVALREQSTPHHLAYLLLDHVGYLTRLGDTQAAARRHSARLAISPASCAASHCWAGPPTSRQRQSPVQDEIAPLPDPEESTDQTGVIPGRSLPIAAADAPRMTIPARLCRFTPACPQRSRTAGSATPNDILN